MANKMITVEQEVQIFRDEDKKGTQKAHLDVDDQWLVVEHDSYEMSMSLENFRKLEKLVNEVVEKSK